MQTLAFIPVGSVAAPTAPTPPADNESRRDAAMEPCGKADSVGIFVSEPTTNFDRKQGTKAASGGSPEVPSGVQ